MKKFYFKFQSLLNYRKHRRELCRIYLGHVLANDRELIAQRHSFEQDRMNQLQELRGLGERGAFDIDSSSSRRYYAGQLVGFMQLVDRNRELVADQMALCRKALSKADQEVKVLEKLEEKQKSEFLYQEERRNAHELEDIWMAGHIEEYKK